MRLFAGIDGGQSSTVAAIGDERGRVVGRGRAGASDEVGQGPESTRMHDALLGALKAALRDGALPPETRFESIVAGVSGYQGRVYGKAPVLPAMHVRLMHDAPVAAAGTLGAGGGVVIVAGTGSVIYAVHDDGSSRTLGGWGFLFGDEGSAFGIARDALATLMRAQDDGDQSFVDVAARVRELFGTATLRDLVHAFAAGEITREAIAQFAPIVLASPQFEDMVQRGAGRLGRLAVRAIRGGAPARVGLCGGVFRDAAFRRRVVEAIHAEVADAEVAPARYEPELGALLLAYRAAGVRVDALHV